MMAMELRPKQVILDAEKRLEIVWNDGQRRRYTVKELRDRCPCATCREKRAEPPKPAALLPVLTLAEAKPMAIAAMSPIGHYAYSITFSDGHDSGIYTLAFLRELGEVVQ
jgi:DUF971 family protein